MNENEKKIDVNDLIEKGKNAVLALEEFAGKKAAQVTELDVIHYFDDIKKRQIIKIHRFLRYFTQ